MLDITNSLLVMIALFNIGIAIFILRGDRRNIINIVLGIYLISLALWSASLIVTQIGSNEVVWLYAAKVVYAAGLVVAASFYIFSIVFPNQQKPTRGTLAWVVSAAAFFITQLFVFPEYLTIRIVNNSWGNGALLNEAHFLIYVAIFCVLYLGGLIRIWIKYFRERPGITKTRLLVIAGAAFITGIAGLYYNIILASPYIDEFRYIWTGPLFNTITSGLIVYSIFRLGLFNTKVLVTEFLIALLWIFTLLRTLVAADPQEQTFNGLLFGLAVIIGFLLIRSVRAEVEARETIEKQAKELEEVNRQQESLLHFISHEIKGYLTKSEAAFAAIHSGDYGATSPELHTMSGYALADVRKGVDTVLDILDASNLKRGTVAYKKEPFNFVRAVEEIVHDLESAAKDRGLALIFDRPITGAYTVVGDEEKIRRHVIRNIIDNSIKYTLKGHVRVELSRNDDVVRLVVSDTGVGITPEDMHHLFTEGGKGAESLKVNVHSTGYGLFIAKTIVEGHGGKIWAESEGKDRGSRFVCEFPIEQ